jgi:outer membrane receptor for ferrienterochelin and colicin/copper chaperone CopZ
MKFYQYLLLLCLVFANQVIFAQDVKNRTITSSTFKVFGACDQCKNRIEKVLKIKGIKMANWDVDTQILALEYSPSQISIEKIQNKILSVGHDLVDKKAKDIIYSELPDCCHYREEGAELVHEVSMATIKGVVLQDNANGKFEPLANATIHWLGATAGVVTDSLGVFAIQSNSITQRLIVSYAGYKADTITVVNANDLKIILATKGQLNEVTIFSRKMTSYIPNLNPIRTQIMTGSELLKAACCNLSESFETNPSVDVSYNDAVTGSKQIQLLGLSGNYTQLTVENLPGPRGLATPLGLNSIAGPWIESIQLTKGVGSVANGFESIAGQINVELKKPETAEKLLGNIYVNGFGKTDLNLNLATKINSKWSTALLLHDNFLNNAVDMNKDGFKDLPTGNELSLVNRYKFDNSKGTLAQFGIKVLNDKKLGGEINFDPTTDKHTENRYGLSIHTERYELFGKMGYVFPQQKYKSIGLQVDAINHNQESYFGLTNYNAKQHSFYSNFLYQSIINSTIHKFRTGISFQYDQYNEDFKLNNYARKEVVPGTFFEYTYTPNDKWSMVAGIRADHNNLYGAFVTPRLNMRYEPITGTTIRLSAGRGQRTANIFAENNSVFVSARQITIVPSMAGGAYGLNPEVAWNKGISVDQKFNFLGNSATFGLDYFRNDFNNQVLVDLENIRLVQFYNLDGKSYSNSFQAELNIEPIKKLDLRLAYRYFDVKQTYTGKLLERPLIAKDRAFLSVDYATANSWKFNYTITYNGKKRIPNSSDNPAMYQLSNYSPSFILMNAQVSKTFNKNHPMDIYMGVENITNYFQQDAILAATTPFSDYFDASMVWGPTYGRMLYLGWRIKIKQ